MAGSPLPSVSAFVFKTAGLRLSIVATVSGAVHWLEKEPEERGLGSFSAYQRVDPVSVTYLSHLCSAGK